jgi:hypothetical protein
MVFFFVAFLHLLVVFQIPDFFEKSGILWWGVQIPFFEKSGILW